MLDEHILFIFNGTVMEKEESNRTDRCLAFRWKKKNQQPHNTIIFNREGWFIMSIPQGPVERIWQDFLTWQSLLSQRSADLCCDSFLQASSRELNYFCSAKKDKIMEGSENNAGMKAIRETSEQMTALVTRFHIRHF